MPKFFAAAPPTATQLLAAQMDVEQQQRTEKKEKKSRCNRIFLTIAIVFMMLGLVRAFFMIRVPGDQHKPTKEDHMAELERMVVVNGGASMPKPNFDALAARERQRQIEIQKMVRDQFLHLKSSGGGGAPSIADYGK